GVRRLAKADLIFDRTRGGDGGGAGQSGCQQELAIQGWFDHECIVWMRVSWKGIAWWRHQSGVAAAGETVSACGDEESRNVSQDIATATITAAAKRHTR